MSANQFIGNTIWISLLIIIFGVLSGIFESNFNTWFFFTFLCIVGFLKALLDLAEKYRTK